MQRQQSFGRRAPPQRKIPSPPPANPVFARIDEPRSVPLISSAPEEGDVDRDVAEWKAARKIRKRSFREPWRSASIACTLGFGAASWLLPESVASIAQLVTTALGAASLYAGLRRRTVTSDSPG
jgi:hypothetical protein